MSSTPGKCKYEFKLLGQSLHKFIYVQQLKWVETGGDVLTAPVKKERDALRNCSFPRPRKGEKLWGSIVFPFPQILTPFCLFIPKQTELNWCTPYRNQFFPQLNKLPARRNMATVPQHRAALHSRTTHYTGRSEGHFIHSKLQGGFRKEDYPYPNCSLVGINTSLLCKKCFRIYNYYKWFRPLVYSHPKDGRKSEDSRMLLQIQRSYLDRIWYIYLEPGERVEV